MILQSSLPSPSVARANVLMELTRPPGSAAELMPLIAFRGADLTNMASKDQISPVPVPTLDDFSQIFT